MAKASVNKHKLKCSFCKKEHAGNPVFKGQGNYVGTSQTLASRLMKEYKLPAFQHPLSVGKGKNKCAEAHHLICSESMNSNVWEKICNSFGYDVNCPENGIMLPSDMAVACHAEVPLHKGNHDDTKGSAGMNYVNTVKQKIDPEASKAFGGDYCENPKEIIEQLNKISKEIWQKVKKFKWTISPDGMHYSPSSKEGCLGVKTHKEKDAVTITKCPSNRNHKPGLSISKGYDSWKEIVNK